jgi:hypothetical protein
MKWSLLVLIVVLGCGSPTTPGPDSEITPFAASGTVERTGEHAWRVEILPGTDSDHAPKAGCASLEYRLGDQRGRGVCRVSVTADLPDPYLEVTVFVTQNDRVTSGVLGGRVPRGSGWFVTRCAVASAGPEAQSKRSGVGDCDAGTVTEGRCPQKNSCR